MDIKMLPVYFLIGGAVIAAVTYFGSQAKGLFAAFIAFIPSISITTLCTIYFSGGKGAALSYAKGMLILVPSWVLYVLGIIFLLPRIGLAGSIIVGVAAYVGTALLIMRLT